MPSAIMNAIDAVFGYFYAITVPDRPRTRPLQVLCSGPSRSGTDSLKQALRELGYPKVFHGYETMLTSNCYQKPALSRLVEKKYHSGFKSGDVTFTAEEFDQIFGEYDALTDMPRNDVDACYKSFDATLMADRKEWSSSYTCSWFSPDLYWSKRLVHRQMMPESFRSDFKANGKWIYREHCAMTRGLVPKECFLEWGIEDGWGHFVNFWARIYPKLNSRMATRQLHSQK